MKNWLVFLTFAVVVLVLGNCGTLTSHHTPPTIDVQPVHVSNAEIRTALRKHDKYIKEYVYHEMDKNHDKSMEKMNEILTKLKSIEDKLDAVEKVVRKLD